MALCSGERGSRWTRPAGQRPAGDAGTVLRGASTGRSSTRERCGSSSRLRVFASTVGTHALEYQEEDGQVALRCRDVNRGGERMFAARRLFLGLGAVASTRLVARSLSLYGQPIRLLESQYFFFPWLSYRRHHDARIEFTLAEVFVEILNHRISSHYVHFQVYGLNQIFRSAIREMLPGPLRWAPFVRQLEGRFFLFQGFLPSQESGHMLMTVTRSSVDNDAMRIVGIPSRAAMATARRARAMIRRRLAGAGLVPPGSLEMVALGRSFHLGGSFPMGASNAVYSSDDLGRPAGSSHVHLWTHQHSRASLRQRSPSPLWRMPTASAERRWPWKAERDQRAERANHGG